MKRHVAIRLGMALAFSVLALACSTPAERGEGCGDSDECAEGLACVETSALADPGVCMETCDPTASWLCESGEVCLDVADAPDRGVCHLGGALPVGASCLDRELDCVSGAVCITFSEGARVECVKACRLDGDDCADDERCAILIEERGAGFCEPA